jgi:hypothetical protein
VSADFCALHAENCTGKSLYEATWAATASSPMQAGGTSP